MKYFIGLDIGGTKCAVVLATVSQGIQIRSKIAFPTETQKGFEYAKSKLIETINEILMLNGLKVSDVHAIGVSCGGPLDSRKGLIMSPPNLPGWDNIPFTDLLTQEFGIPAFMQNDANACALVEWKLGAGRGVDNVIFLTMGTGMGAGIIAEGRLLRGPSDMAGEVGHIRLEDEGPIGFGKAGSFEGFCSGGGIGRQAQEMSKGWVKDGKPPQWIRDGVEISDISAKMIAEYANVGNEEAKEIYRFVGRKLGKGISILIDVLNPEVIVIGSIFVRSENLLREAMETVIDKEALIHSRRVCKVIPAKTGESLGDLASIMVACYALDINPEFICEDVDMKI